MKKRVGDPWMSADEYGRSLKGLGINLLVTSIEQARYFHTEVLAAEEVYWDSDGYVWFSAKSVFPYGGLFCGPSGSGSCLASLSRYILPGLESPGSNITTLYA